MAELKEQADEAARRAQQQPAPQPQRGPMIPPPAVQQVNPPVVAQDARARLEPAQAQGDAILGRAPPTPADLSRQLDDAAASLNKYIPLVTGGGTTVRLGDTDITQQAGGLAGLLMVAKGRINGEYGLPQDLDTARQALALFAQAEPRLARAVEAHDKIDAVGRDAQQQGNNPIATNSKEVNNNVERSVSMLFTQPDRVEATTNLAGRFVERPEIMNDSRFRAALDAVSDPAVSHQEAFAVVGRFEGHLQMQLQAMMQQAQLLIATGKMKEDLGKLRDEIEALLGSKKSDKEKEAEAAELEAKLQEKGFKALEAALEELGAPKELVDAVKNSKDLVNKVARRLLFNLAALYVKNPSAFSDPQSRQNLAKAAEALVSTARKDAKPDYVKTTLTAVQNFVRAGEEKIKRLAEGAAQLLEQRTGAIKSAIAALEKAEKLEKNEALRNLYADLRSQLTKLLVGMKEKDGLAKTSADYARLAGALEYVGGIFERLSKMPEETEDQKKEKATLGGLFANALRAVIQDPKSEKSELLKFCAEDFMRSIDAAYKSKLADWSNAINSGKTKIEDAKNELCSFLLKKGEGLLGAITEPKIKDVIGSFLGILRDPKKASVSEIAKASGAVAIADSFVRDVQPKIAKDEKLKEPALKFVSRALEALNLGTKEEAGFQMDLAKKYISSPEEREATEKLSLRVRSSMLTSRAKVQGSGEALAQSTRMASDLQREKVEVLRALANAPKELHSKISGLLDGINRMISRLGDSQEKVGENEVALLAKRITELKKMVEDLSKTESEEMKHNLTVVYSAALDALEKGDLKLFNLLMFSAKELKANAGLDKESVNYRKVIMNGIGAVATAKTPEEKLTAISKLVKTISTALSERLTKAAKSLDGQTQTKIEALRQKISVDGATTEDLERATQALAIAKSMSEHLKSYRPGPKEDGEGIKKNATALYHRSLDVLIAGGEATVAGSQMFLAEKYLEMRDETHRSELAALSARVEKDPEAMRDVETYIHVNDRVAALRKQIQGLPKGSPAIATLEKIAGELEKVKAAIANGQELITEQQVRARIPQVTEALKTNEALRATIIETAKEIMARAKESGQEITQEEALNQALFGAAVGLARVAERERVNGLVDVADLAAKAGAHPKAELNELLDLSASAYISGDLNKGDLFSHAAKSYTSLADERDRKEVFDIAKKYGTKAIDLPTATFLLSIYSPDRIKYEGKIKDRAQSRNAKAYFDLAIVAAKNGDMEGAELLRKLAFTYLTLAAIDPAHLNPEEREKRTQTMEGIEKQLGDYRKNPDLLKGKRFIDIGAEGKEGWQPKDGSIESPIALAILGKKPLKQELGDRFGNVQAAATESAKVPVLLYNSADFNALAGITAGEKRNLDTAWKKERDRLLQKAAEHRKRGETALAEHYEGEASRADRSFVVESVGKAKELLKRSAEESELAANLESEAQKAKTEADAANAAGDKEKAAKLLVQASQLHEQAGEHSANARDLLQRATELNDNLQALDRSVRKINTMHRESGRFDLMISVRTTLAVGLGYDVDGMGEPLVRIETSPTGERRTVQVKLSEDRTEYLLKQAGALSKAGNLAVKEQHDIMKARDQGMASAKVQLHDFSMQQAAELIGKLIVRMPKDKWVELIQQFTGLTATEEEKADPNKFLQRAVKSASMDGLQKLYFALADRTGTKVAFDDHDGVRKTAFDPVENDKKYKNALGLWGSEKFAAARAYTRQAAFEMRTGSFIAGVYVDGIRLSDGLRAASGPKDSGFIVGSHKIQGPHSYSLMKQLLAHLPPEVRAKYEAQLEKVDKGKAGDEARLMVYNELYPYINEHVWGGKPLDQRIIDGDLLYFDQTALIGRAVEARGLAARGNIGAAESSFSTVQKDAKRDADLQDQDNDRVSHDYAEWDYLVRAGKAKKEGLPELPDVKEGDMESARNRKAVQAKRDDMESGSVGAHLAALKKRAKENADASKAALAARDSIMRTGGRIRIDEGVVEALVSNLVPPAADDKIHKTHYEAIRRMRDEALKIEDPQKRAEKMQEVWNYAVENTPESLILAVGAASRGSVFSKEELTQLTALTGGVFVKRNNRDWDINVEPILKTNIQKEKDFRMDQLSTRDKEERRKLQEKADELKTGNVGMAKYGYGFTEDPSRVAAILRHQKEDNQRDYDLLFSHTVEDKYTTKKPEESRQASKKFAAQLTEQEMNLRLKMAGFRRKDDGTLEKLSMTPEEYQRVAEAYNQFMVMKNELKRTLPTINAAITWDDQKKYLETVLGRMDAFYRSADLVTKGGDAKERRAAFAQSTKLYESAQPVSEQGVDYNYHTRKYRESMQSWQAGVDLAEAGVKMVAYGAAFAVGGPLALAAGGLGAAEGFMGAHDYYESCGGDWSMMSTGEQVYFGFQIGMATLSAVAPVLSSVSEARLAAQALESAATTGARATPLVARVASGLGTTMIIGGAVQTGVTIYDLNRAVDAGQMPGWAAIGQGLIAGLQGGVQPGLHMLRGARMGRTGMPIERGRALQIGEMLLFGTPLESREAFHAAYVEGLTRSTLQTEISKLSPVDRTALTSYVERRKVTSPDSQLDLVVRFDQARSTNRDISFGDFAGLNERYENARKAKPDLRFDHFLASETKLNAEEMRARAKVAKEAKEQSEGGTSIGDMRRMARDFEKKATVLPADRKAEAVDLLRKSAAYEREADRRQAEVDQGLRKEFAGQAKVAQVGDQPVFFVGEAGEVTGYGPKRMQTALELAAAAEQVARGEMSIDEAATRARANLKARGIELEHKDSIDAVSSLVMRNEFLGASTLAKSPDTKGTGRSLQLELALHVAGKIPGMEPEQKITVAPPADRPIVEKLVQEYESLGSAAPTEVRTPPSREYRRMLAIIADAQKEGKTVTPQEAAMRVVAEAREKGEPLSWEQKPVPVELPTIPKERVLTIQDLRHMWAERPGRLELERALKAAGADEQTIIHARILDYLGRAEEGFVAPELLPYWRALKGTSDPLKIVEEAKRFVSKPPPEAAKPVEVVPPPARATEAVQEIRVTPVQTFGMEAPPGTMPQQVSPRPRGVPPPLPQRARRAPQAEAPKVQSQVQVSESTVSPSRVQNIVREYTRYTEVYQAMKDGRVSLRRGDPISGVDLNSPLGRDIEAIRLRLARGEGLEAATRNVLQAKGPVGREIVAVADQVFQGKSPQEAANMVLQQSPPQSPEQLGTMGRQIHDLAEKRRVGYDITPEWDAFVLDIPLQEAMGLTPETRLAKWNSMTSAEKEASRQRSAAATPLLSSSEYVAASDSRRVEMADKVGTGLELAAKPAEAPKKPPPLPARAIEQSVGSNPGRPELEAFMEDHTPPLVNGVANERNKQIRRAARVLDSLRASPYKAPPEYRAALDALKGSDDPVAILEHATRIVDGRIPAAQGAVVIPIARARGRTIALDATILEGGVGSRAGRPELEGTISKQTVVGAATIGLEEIPLIVDTPTRPELESALADHAKRTGRDDPELKKVVRILEAVRGSASVESVPSAYRQAYAALVGTDNPVAILNEARRIVDIRKIARTLDFLRTSPDHKAPPEYRAALDALKGSDDPVAILGHAVRIVDGRTTAAVEKTLGLTQGTLANLGARVVSVTDQNYHIVLDIGGAEFPIPPIPRNVDPQLLMGALAELPKLQHTPGSSQSADAWMNIGRRIPGDQHLESALRAMTVDSSGNFNERTYNSPAQQNTRAVARVLDGLASSNLSEAELPPEFRNAVRLLRDIQGASPEERGIMIAHIASEYKLINDSIEVMKLTLAGRGPAAEPILLEFKTFAAFNLHRIAELPIAERANASSRFWRSFEYLVGRATENPARTEAWVTFMRTREDVESFALLARRRLVPSLEGITIQRSPKPDPATRRMNDSIINAVAMARVAAQKKPEATTPIVLHSIISTMPDAWFTAAGYSKNNIAKAIVEGRGHEAIRDLNLILNERGLALFENSGVIALYRTTHTMSSSKWGHTRGAILDPIRGEPDILRGNLAVYHPQMDTIFLHRKAETFTVPTKMKGDTVIRIVYVHEFQHLYDGATGYLKASRLPGQPDLSEATTIARETMQLGFEGCSAQDIARHLAKRARGQTDSPYRIGAERIMQYLDANLPGWRAEKDTRKIVGKIGNYIDHEYAGLLGLGLTELIGTYERAPSVSEALARLQGKPVEAVSFEDRGTMIFKAPPPEMFSSLKTKLDSLLAWIEERRSPSVPEGPAVHVPQSRVAAAVEAPVAPHEARIMRWAEVTEAVNQLDSTLRRLNAEIRGALENGDTATANRLIDQYNQLRMRRAELRNSIAIENYDNLTPAQLLEHARAIDRVNSHPEEIDQSYALEIEAAKRKVSGEAQAATLPQLQTKLADANARLETQKRRVTEVQAARGTSRRQLEEAIQKVRVIEAEVATLNAEIGRRPAVASKVAEPSEFQAAGISQADMLQRNASYSGVVKDQALGGMVPGEHVFVVKIDGSDVTIKISEFFKGDMLVRELDRQIGLKKQEIKPPSPAPPPRVETVEPPKVVEPPPKVDASVQKPEPVAKPPVVDEGTKPEDARKVTPSAPQPVEVSGSELVGKLGLHEPSHRSDFMNKLAQGDKEAIAQLDRLGLPPKAKEDILAAVGRYNEGVEQYRQKIKTSPAEANQLLRRATMALEGASEKLQSNLPKAAVEEKPSAPLSREEAHSALEILSGMRISNGDERARASDALERLPGWKFRDATEIRDFFDRFKIASPEEALAIADGLAQGKNPTEAFVALAERSTRTAKDLESLEHRLDALERSGPEGKKEAEKRRAELETARKGIGKVLEYMKYPEVREKILRKWDGLMQARAEDSAWFAALEEQSKPPKVNERNHALVGGGVTSELLARRGLAATPSDVQTAYGMKPGATDAELATLDAARKRALTAVGIETNQPSQPVFDLVFRADVEGRIRGLSGPDGRLLYENGVVKKVEDLGGGTGAFKITLDVNGERKTIIVKRVNGEADALGATALQIAGLAPQIVHARDSQGKPFSYETGVSYEHPPGTMKKARQELVFIEDIHDYTGKNVTIYLDGRDQTVKVEGVALAGAGELLSELQQGPKPGENPAIAEFRRLLSTPEGRKKIMQRWLDYQEMASIALVGDRHARNTTVFLIRKENGELDLTFQPIDTDPVGFRLGVKKNDETKTVNPDFREFNDDFAAGTDRFLEFLATAASDSRSGLGHVKQPTLVNEMLGVLRERRDNPPSLQVKAKKVKEYYLSPEHAGKPVGMSDPNFRNQGRIGDVVDHRMGLPEVVATADGRSVLDSSYQQRMGELVDQAAATGGRRNFLDGQISKLEETSSWLAARAPAPHPAEGGAATPLPLREHDLPPEEAPVAPLAQRMFPARALDIPAEFAGLSPVELRQRAGGLRKKANETLARAGTGEERRRVEVEVKQARLLADRLEIEAARQDMTLPVGSASDLRKLARQKEEQAKEIWTKRDWKSADEQRKGFADADRFAAEAVVLREEAERREAAPVVNSPPPGEASIRLTPGGTKPGIGPSKPLDVAPVAVEAKPVEAPKIDESARARRMDQNRIAQGMAENKDQLFELAVKVARQDSEALATLASLGTHPAANMIREFASNRGFKRAAEQNDETGLSRFKQHYVPALAERIRAETVKIVKDLAPPAEGQK